MKLFPIREDILRKSASEIRIKIPYMDRYSDEFKNTVANCFYCRNYVFHFGEGSFTSLLLGAADKKSSSLISRYISTVIINGAEYAEKICDSTKSLSENDQNYFLQVFLDSVKYNITDAEKKSLVRRTVERKFSSPFPEHSNLWAQMVKLSTPNKRSP